MSKEVKKYEKALLLLVVSIILLCLVPIGFAQIRDRLFERRVGPMLGIGTNPTKNKIIVAIPDQFEIGSSRSEVHEKVLAIYPEIDLDDPAILDGEEHDYVHFYREHFYGAAYLFIYDEEDNLIEIKLISS